ncbi:MAG: PQQ-binding-like beta-propeller repeat protein [Planctomycetaceae bacterium]
MFSPHTLSGVCLQSFFRPLLARRCSVVRLTALLILLSAVANFSLASDRVNWPMRSGPRMDSVVAAEDAKNLPLSWSEEKQQGIEWKIKLQDFGHSTPAIGFGKIWLTAATEGGEKQYIYCIDQQPGKVLNHKLLFENTEIESLNNPINTYASPSCALTDQAVYVHFGTYGTACLNSQTCEVIWERRDINCRHFRGPGSSPVIWENLLLLTFDGVDAQFVTALDRSTGKTVWKTNRTTDYGDLDANGKPKLDGDLRKAYGTPTVMVAEGRAHVVSIGSRAAFAYDARSGEELWTIRHDDFNASSPPLYYRGHAILNTGSRGANLLSVKLGETTRGDVSESHVVWNRPKGNSDLSAPVLVGNRIYSVANNGVVTSVNADSGEEVWKGRIDGAFTASPIVADDRIYFCNEAGDCFVVRAADQFEVLSQNTLAEGMRASPAAADGRLFLRTFGHLYALKK